VVRRYATHPISCASCANGTGPAVTRDERLGPGRRQPAARRGNLEVKLALTRMLAEILLSENEEAPRLPISLGKRRGPVVGRRRLYRRRDLRLSRPASLHLMGRSEGGFRLSWSTTRGRRNAQRRRAWYRCQILRPGDVAGSCKWTVTMPTWQPRCRCRSTSMTCAWFQTGSGNGREMRIDLRSNR
jgi:hypothetical protein